MTVIPIVLGALGRTSQRINKGTRRLRKQRTSRDNPNNCITKIGQKTEKSPENLRRLTVTQTLVRNYQLTLVWKTFKGINNIYINIPTGNITELNELIDAGAQVVLNKISVPQGNPNRNTKPNREIWQESQVKKLWQQAKVQRKKKRERINWDEKTKIKLQTSLILKLEKTNQKMIDWLFNWADTLNWQVYSNGWLRRRQPWSRKIPKKEQSPATIDK